MNLKEKYAGKSFAEIAETISKKYKNREIDPVQKRSFETEINALKDLQETYRLKESIKDRMKMAGGGMLSTALNAGKGIAEAFAGALTVPMKAVGGNIDDNELYGLTRSLSQLDIENYQKQQQEGQFAALPTFTSPLTSTANIGTPEPKPTIYEAIGSKPQIASRNSMIADKMVTPTIDSGTMPDEVPFTTRETEEIDYDRPKLVRKEMRQLKRDYKQDLRDAKEREREENKEPSKIGKFLKSPYGALATGKGIEMLGKSAMLLGGYDKFSPNYNPFEQEALNLMRSQGIDTQAVENKILSQQEAAMAGTGNVRSTAVQQALQQGIYANTSDALANTELQQQQMRNQLSLQMANALNVAGQQRVEAENLAQQFNMASKASYQQNVVDLLETVGAAGEEISAFKQGQVSDKLMLNLMNKIYDFGYDTDCVMANLATGDISKCYSAKKGAETGVDREGLSATGNQSNSTTTTSNAAPAASSTSTTTSSTPATSSTPETANTTTTTASTPATETTGESNTTPVTENTTEQDVTATMPSTESVADKLYTDDDSTAVETVDVESLANGLNLPMMGKATFDNLNTGTTGFQVDKSQPTYYQDFKRGLDFFFNQNTRSPEAMLLSILGNDSYSDEQKKTMVDKYTDSPLGAYLSEALNVFAPADLLSKIMQTNPADKESGYSLQDALAGYKNNASMLEDILYNPASWFQGIIKYLPVPSLPAGRQYKPRPKQIAPPKSKNLPAGQQKRLPGPDATGLPVGPKIPQLPVGSGQMPMLDANILKNPELLLRMLNQ